MSEDLKEVTENVETEVNTNYAALPNPFRGMIMLKNPAKMKMRQEMKAILDAMPENKRDQYILDNYDVLFEKVEVVKVSTEGVTGMIQVGDLVAVNKSKMQGAANMFGGEEYIVVPESVVYAIW